MCFFVVEGLPGVLVNKGTLAKYRREQGNISQFLGTGEQNSKNYSTKTFGKCVGTWEHRAILEGNKGTRTPPPRETLVVVKGAKSRFVHLKKKTVSLNFSSLSFAIRVNLFLPLASLFLFGSFLSLWCLFTQANYYLKVSLQ